MITTGASTRSPNRAATRSVVRGTGGASTTNSAASAPSPSLGSSTSVSTGAALAGATRPNATRTVAVETPVSEAIFSNVALAASRPAIRRDKEAVSLIGPLGPVRARTKASTPPAAKSRLHVHNVTPLTPNPAATSWEVAILAATSCTAASRRPTSSAGP